MQSSTNCGFVTGTTASFIQNQNASAQATSNFWISGTGRADTSFSTPLVVNGSTADNILTLQGNTAAAGNTATSPNIQFKVGDTGGTTAMTILNNGNVGVGTTGPRAKLDVNGYVLIDVASPYGAVGLEVGTTRGGDNRGTVMIGSATSAGAINFRRADGGGGFPMGLVGYNTGADIGDFRVTSAGGQGTLYMNTPGGGVYINNAGSVGVNTLSPTTAKLVIKGTTTDNTAASLNVTDSADASLLYVRNDGNIGIGTNSPNAKLEINAATTSNIGLIVKSTDDNSAYKLQEWRNSSNNVLGSINNAGLFQAVTV